MARILYQLPSAHNVRYVRCDLQAQTTDRKINLLFSRPRSVAVVVGRRRRRAGSMLPVRLPASQRAAEGNVATPAAHDAMAWARGDRAASLAPRVVLSDVRNAVIGEGNDGVRWPLGGLHGRARSTRSGGLEYVPHHHRTLPVLAP